MSLLQLVDGYLQTAGWELQKAARSLGLPAPPVVQLPPVPTATTSCDLAALTSTLGSAAAAALRTQLGGPDIGALLTDNLSAAKAQLTGYAGMLDAQIASVTAELLRQTGIVEALGTAQDTLTGVQALLGDTTVAEVAAACPAAGYALSMVQNTVGTAQADVQGAMSLITAGQARLQGLVNAKGLATGLITELDSRLTALPGILAVFHA